MASTRAKPILPNIAYHVIRRVAGRERRLLPDKDTTQLLSYVLGLALRRHSVDLLGSTFHTNHHHQVITDVEANLPAFLQLQHSLIARSLNARDERPGAFWDSQGTTLIPIKTPEQLLKTLAYVTANPVKDGLVSAPKHWPGFLTRPCHVGTTFKVRRPPWAFFGGSPRKVRPSSSLPSTVSIPVKFPSRFFSDPEAFKAAYQAEVDAQVSAAHKTHKGFLGRDGVLGMDRFGSPPTPKPPKPKPNRPVLEGKALDRWRCAYVEARDHWSDPSLPNLAFPPGSWLLPRLYKAPVQKRPA